MSPADQLLSLCWDNATRGSNTQYVAIAEVPALMRELETLLKQRPLLTPEQAQTLANLARKQPWLRLFKREFQAFFLQLVHTNSVEEFLKSRCQLSARDVLGMVDRLSGSKRDGRSLRDYQEERSGVHLKREPVGTTNDTRRDYTDNRRDFIDHRRDYTDRKREYTDLRGDFGRFGKTINNSLGSSRPASSSSYFNSRKTDDLAKAEPMPGAETWKHNEPKGDETWFGRWKRDATETWSGLFRPAKKLPGEIFERDPRLHSTGSQKAADLSGQVAQLKASLRELQKYSAELESKLQANESLSRKATELDQLCSQYERQLRERSPQVSESKLRALQSSIESQDALIARLERRLRREQLSGSDVFSGRLPGLLVDTFRDALSRGNEPLHQWAARVASVFLTLFVFSSVVKFMYLAVVSVLLARSHRVYEPECNESVGFSWLLEYPSLEYALYQATEWMGY